MCEYSITGLSRAITIGIPIDAVSWIANRMKPWLEACWACAVIPPDLQQILRLTRSRLRPGESGLNDLACCQVSGYSDWIDNTNVRGSAMNQMTIDKAKNKIYIEPVSGLQFSTIEKDGRRWKATLHITNGTANGVKFFATKREALAYFGL